MISVAKASIPDYLLESEFFKSLEGSEDEVIEIPANVLKQDTLIESNDDCELLLSTVRFWGLDCCPDSVVMYILEHHASTLVLLEEFESQLTYIPTIRNIAVLEPKERVKAAIESGQLDILKCLLRNGYLWDRDSCDYAAASGHLDILKFAFESGCRVYMCTIRMAAHNGHIHCIEYLRSVGCEWNDNACIHAAEQGQLECLKYLHTHGCPWTVHTALGAAKCGQLPCLMYLHEHGCPVHSAACAAAAEGGHLDCMQYAYSKGNTMYTNALFCAAGSGSVPCVEFALSTMYCDPTLINYAARFGRLEVITYLHEVVGLPWRDDTDCVAIAGGHAHCLQYIYEHGCVVHEKAAVKAAAAGHLDCLKLAMQHGAQCKAEDCNSAVFGKHTACVEYLRTFHEHVDTGYAKAKNTET